MFTEADLGQFILLNPWVAFIVSLATTDTEKVLLIRR